MSDRPEYNVTDHDYSRREHLPYRGPIIDIHSHVTMTAPADKPAGPAGGHGRDGSSDAAAVMLDVAAEFGIKRTYSMCPLADVDPLKERLGERIGFNAMINKKPEDPDDEAYRQLDGFLERGIEIVKLWSAPRGRERGLVVDAPWRIESVRRAIQAGIRIVMVHVGDPDAWFRKVYTDPVKFGTKPEQYVPFRRMLEMFPEVAWIGAHLGGDPEHPDHLEALLDAYPHLHFDTSATKWVVREVSPRAQAYRDLLRRKPTRFLFGSDLVTRHPLHREHYVSRYWCQRTLWESTWRGVSPIHDPDHDGEGTPVLEGLGLPAEVLDHIYHRNARRLLGHADG